MVGEGPFSASRPAVPNGARCLGDHMTCTIPGQRLRNHPFEVLQLGLQRARLFKQLLEGDVLLVGAPPRDEKLLTLRQQSVELAGGNSNKPVRTRLHQCGRQLGPYDLGFRRGAGPTSLSDRDQLRQQPVER